MSGATFTAVNVTLPTRGSRTSRETSVDSTRCISPSMRPRRCDLALICLYGPASLDAAGHLDAGVALDLIADAHVLVVLHADAAFRTRTYFVRLVLEAAQRFQ